MLIEIVAESNHPISGKDAKQSLVNFVEVDRRSPAELGEFGIRAKDFDASEGEMCQLRAPIQKLMNTVNSQMHAITQMNPLQRTHTLRIPIQQTQDCIIRNLLALDEANSAQLGQRRQTLDRLVRQMCTVC